MEAHAIPERLTALESLVLRHGNHDHFDEGAACAMEVTAWLAGEGHTDHPECTCPVLAAFVISRNDSYPKTAEGDAARTRDLLPFLPRLIGTRSTHEVEVKRSLMALDWLIREYVPAWLELVPATREHAATLRALAPIVDLATAKAAGPAVQSAGSTAAAAGAAARAAAWDAARAAAWDAAWDAAGAAARAAAWDAAGAAAWDAAWDAAGAAARAAARAAAWDAAWDAARAAAGAAARAAARAAAWDAAWDAAGAAAWDAAGAAARAAARAAAWDAAWDAAGAAARAAAGKALAPTVERLQASAALLLDRMIEAR